MGTRHAQLSAPSDDVNESAIGVEGKRHGTEAEVLFRREQEIYGAEAGTAARV